MTSLDRLIGAGARPNLRVSDRACPETSVAQRQRSAHCRRDVVRPVLGNDARRERWSLCECNGERRGRRHVSVARIGTHMLNVITAPSSCRAATAQHPGSENFSKDA